MALFALPSPTIEIRPIRGEDSARLQAHHDRLSPESRYRRFLSAKPQLTAADLHYLAEVDGSDHVALVATLPDQAGAPIVAVARFVRLPEDPTVAEMAIVVDDAHQREGLGSELVARLAQAAVAHGVRRFLAIAFPDNLGIRRLLQGIADGPIDYRIVGGLAEIDVTLPGTWDAVSVVDGNPLASSA